MADRDSQVEEKLEWHLIPIVIIEGVIRVLMFGKKKYGAWNWASPNKEGKRFARHEVFNSLKRHMAEMERRHLLDDGPKGSGLHHGFHLVCNAIFAAYYDYYNLWADSEEDYPDVEVEEDEFVENGRPLPVRESADLMKGFGGKIWPLNPQEREDGWVLVTKESWPTKQGKYLFRVINATMVFEVSDGGYYRETGRSIVPGRDIRWEEWDFEDPNQWYYYSKEITDVREVKTILDTVPFGAVCVEPNQQ